MDRFSNWGYVIIFFLLLSVFLGFYVIAEVFILLVLLAGGFGVILIFLFLSKEFWAERKKIKKSLFNWYGKNAPTGHERQQSFVTIIGYLLFGFILYQHAPRYFEIMFGFFKKLTAALTQ